MGSRARREQKTRKRAQSSRADAARRADSTRCVDLLVEAELAFELRELDRAQRLLEKIVRIRPNHQAANELLADLHFRAGNDTAGLTHYERLAQPPAWPPLMLQAAAVWSGLGQYVKSVSVLDELLQVAQSRPELGNLRDQAQALKRLWAPFARRQGATEKRAARVAARAGAQAAAATAPSPAKVSAEARIARTSPTALETFAPALLPFDPLSDSPSVARSPAEAATPVHPVESRADDLPPFPDVPLPPIAVDLEVIRDGFPDRMTAAEIAPIGDVLLRLDYAALRLQKGFDELLSLGAVHDVTHFRYQLETVRRILRDFRGRVLLADEVGLGKTIEACLALKEYWMRGLVRKALILTPASLVSQWADELTSRFGLVPATAGAATLRQEGPDLWTREPLIVASLPLVRQAAHRDRLAAIDYDLVIVDEAHVLKNRASAAWQLVNSLKTRFLLLLSATPVGNDVRELYNLILLLRPGLLQTEAKFRRDYGHVAALEDPRRRDRLRTLLREVMVRNTRAHIDLKLPRRVAATEVVRPDPAEAEALARLTAVVRQRYPAATGPDRWRLMMLQMQAGSSPSALRHGLRDTETGGRADADLRSVLDALESVAAPAKTRALLSLLRRSPDDKKIIFTRFRATLDDLARALAADGHHVAVFHGGLTAAEKDAAIARFRDDAEILLASEVGGEGRNLQFCRTVINFDLPWSPTTIEQRVGRVHRLGQTRDVYVFNFCLAGSIEERILGILHDKINLFELIAGEVEMILGELDPDQDFASLVMDAWTRSGTPEDEARAFDDLSVALVRAKAAYQKTHEIDRALFREDYEV